MNRDVQYWSTVDKSIILDSDKTFLLEELTINEICGRFILKYKNIDWECLFIPGKRDRLVVGLNAAGTRPDNRPRFNRWTFQDIFDCCFLSIEDPMYKRYHVPTGWYFGDRDHDYCVYIAEIIDYIKNKYHFENILFYSSSAGGTASIRVANILHYGNVITFCPQLDLLKHHEKSITAIENVIGCSITEDKLHRNELIIQGMHQAINKDVKYVIFENMSSAIDKLHAKILSNSFKIDKVENGVNYLSDNVVIWAYEADDGINAHNAMDFRSIVPYILKSCNNFFRDGRFSTNDCLCVNMLWHDRFQDIKTINMLKHKASVFVIENNNSLFEIKESVKWELENIKIQKSSSQYNWWKIQLNNGRLYEIKLYCTSKDTSDYSIALYDFQHEFQLFRRDCKVENEERLVFLTDENEKQSDIALLIYAGIHGNTRDNELVINKIIVHSKLISSISSII